MGQIDKILADVISGRHDKNMYNYEILLYWSKDDEAFIAEVPELPGCMADGKTRAEAIKNAETIIMEWIETAIEDNEPIPVPRGKLMYA